MFWEIIATVIAGLGSAGIVLSARLLIKKLPKWLVPAGAGLGMLGFQVYSEYTWFEHTRSMLPKTATVVASTGVPAFYKPWSYYHAPVLKFITVDKNNVSPTDTPDILQTNLYFFERREPAQTMSILVNCKDGVQSDLTTSSTPNWGKLPFTDDIVKAICPKL